MAGVDDDESADMSGKGIEQLQSRSSPDTTDPPEPPEPPELPPEPPPDPPPDPPEPPEPPPEPPDPPEPFPDPSVAEGYNESLINMGKVSSILPSATTSAVTVSFPFLMACVT